VSRLHPFERVGVAPPSRRDGVGDREEGGECVARRAIDFVKDESTPTSVNTPPRSYRWTFAPLKAVLATRHPRAGDLPGGQILGTDETFDRDVADAKVQRGEGFTRPRRAVQHNP